MTNKIIEYVNRFVQLSEEDGKELSASFKMVKIKKRQFIVQPNFIATNRYYVLEGAFRAYVVNNCGHDHTIAFAIEDWWITDYNSYILQKPATMFVVALEDSIILEISNEKEQALKKSIIRLKLFLGSGRKGLRHSCNKE